MLGGHVIIELFRLFFFFLFIGICKNVEIQRSQQNYHVHIIIICGPIFNSISVAYIYAKMMILYYDLVFRDVFVIIPNIVINNVWWQLIQLLIAINLDQLDLMVVQHFQLILLMKHYCFKEKMQNQLKTFIENSKKLRQTIAQYCVPIVVQHLMHHQLLSYHESVTMLNRLPKIYITFFFNILDLF